MTRHSFRSGWCFFFALAVVWIGINYLFVGSEGLVICPMRRFLHIPCPGCGLTRASMRLIDGDIAGAMEMNYNVVFVALFILGSVPLYLLELKTGKVYDLYVAAEKSRTYRFSLYIFAAIELIIYFFKIQPML